MIFVKRLLSWDNSVKGRCSNGGIFNQENSHGGPYVLITCLYLFIILSWGLDLPIIVYSWILSIKNGERFHAKVSGRLKHILVLLAATQDPIHLYSIFSLRAANEYLLSNEVSETQWGFGQVVAIVLLGVNVASFVDAIQG